MYEDKAKCYLFTMGKEHRKGIAKTNERMGRT